MRTKIGINTGILYLNIYPKKEGISTPSCSAIALTIKFGPLPMYVIAPIKTEPKLTAIRRATGISPLLTGSNSPSGNDCASLKNTQCHVCINISKRSRLRHEFTCSNFDQVRSFVEQYYFLRFFLYIFLNPEVNSQSQPHVNTH